MNERERQLIEGILNTGDRRLHNRCIQLLFHGQDASRRDERVLYKKNEYVVALENAVRTNFSGRHYQGLFPETYMVFESLFVTYLEHLNPEKLREIEDLKNWLFVAAGRFCNSNRSRINELLGIETSDLTEEFDDNSKENVTNDETGHDEVTPFIGGAVIKAQSTTNDVGNQVQTDDPNEPSDSAGWAESLLNSFIDKISNEYYRDLIRAIKIESVAVNTIAEEYGKTTDDIYRDYNRAWDKLLQVSLPDIRFRSKRLLKKHEADFDDTQADLLNKFFFSSGTDCSYFS